MSGVYGIDVDAQGRLWVADFDNNRVMMWEAASFLGNHAPADRVFGQPDFATNSADTTAAKMNQPVGIFVDAQDRLWVAEFGNRRILRFDAISAKSSGTAADGVLGQPDFTTNSADVTAAKVSGVTDVRMTADGTLWTVDYNANRVLRFDNAATLPNGAPASGVLGQPDFTSFAPSLSAAGMNFPFGLALDPAGNLWVSDYGHARALRFDSPAGKPNGGAADGVLGQPDFTSTTTGPTAALFVGPFGLTFDPAGRLWAADYGASRVLRFTPDSTPPAIEFKGKLPKTTGKSKLKIKGTATDAAGVALVQARVGGGAFTNASGTTTWTFTARLKSGRNRIQAIATDAVGNTSQPISATVRRK